MLDIKAIQATSWSRALKAARKTVGKEDINKEPSDEFKEDLLLAEHSPIRLVEYDIDIDNVRQWVSVHFVRHHEGCEKFVHSQREDREDRYACSRDDLPQGSLNDMAMTCNAQALINISRKRLCSCASPETREVWKKVKLVIKDIDPVMADKMQPECIYRGFCPEGKKCCGYVKTKVYAEELKRYRGRCVSPDNLS